MRLIARVLLLMLAFAIPWQYSLEFGEPLGNIARVLGILTLLAIVPVVLNAGGMRPVSKLHWLTLAFFVWMCATYFWSIDSHQTVDHLRGNFQELMILWLVWELIEDARELRMLIRAFVAGLFVLAVLTIAAAYAGAAGQDRFAAWGHDPNDVARFVDLGFPLAAWLGMTGHRTTERLIALAYLPIGLAAVLLTASRGGAVAGAVALAGAIVLCARAGVFKVGYVLAVTVVAFAALAFVFWLPMASMERVLTIPAQLNGGNLNQRLGIWEAGAQALGQAPIFGSGAGTFVDAAGLAGEDTAHNTPLAIAVEGGLVALTLSFAMLVLIARAAFSLAGLLRIALLFALVVWCVTSLVATAHENRTTWVLLSLMAVAGRLAHEVKLPGGSSQTAAIRRESVAAVQHAG